MGLRYRAIWRDDRPDLLERARETFHDWITAKGMPIDVLPEDGTWSREDCEVEVRHAADHDASILQATLVEHKNPSENSERWTTTARCEVGP